MEMAIIRKPTVRETTFGDWLIDGAPTYKTLEDAVREIPGEPVEKWKIKGKTAIPAGRYRLTLERSPRFGSDTITVNNVPGFVGVRVHGGTDVNSTEGCPIIGDHIDEESLTISGAKLRGVLTKLKETMRAAIKSGDTVWLTVVNPT